MLRKGKQQRHTRLQVPPASSRNISLQAWHPATLQSLQQRHWVSCRFDLAGPTWQALPLLNKQGKQQQHHACVARQALHQAVKNSSNITTTGMTPSHDWRCVTTASSWFIMPTRHIHAFLPQA
jgi:hypothetical protein